MAFSYIVASTLILLLLIFFVIVSVIGIIFTIIFVSKFGKIAASKGYKEFKTAVTGLGAATIILSILSITAIIVNIMAGYKVAPAILSFYSTPVLIFLFSIPSAAVSIALFVIEILIIVFKNKNINSEDISGCSNKSRKIDTLLCFLLGALGVHRYYEGKIGTGVLWTLTGGLCGIGYLVDILIILSGKSKDKDRKAILLWETADKAVNQ